MPVGELGGEQSVAEAQRALVDRDDPGLGSGPVSSMTDTRSPTRAWAESARSRLSAIALPRERIGSGSNADVESSTLSFRRGSGRGSRHPRRPGSGRGWWMSARRPIEHPGVARTSVRVAGGEPEPALVTTRSWLMPACRWVAMAWWNLVLLDEQRGAHRDGQDQRRAGGGEEPRRSGEVPRTRGSLPPAISGKGRERAGARRRAPRSVRGSRRRSPRRSPSSPTSPQRSSASSSWSPPRRVEPLPRSR